MPKKSSSDLRGNRKQGDVLATLLGEILGIILVALLTLVVTGRPPDPLVYVGIVLAFIGLPVLAALVALYLVRRSSPESEFQQALTASVLARLDISIVNPRRASRARHG